MPVTFYGYEDAQDIPESVQELVELTKRPLRGTERLASLPSMTPLALAQLQRIPDRASDADASTSDDSLNKISSVANLVLLTSKAIEESVHDSIEARPTISHWYTLLRTIAQSSHPDAHVMGDVSFIYPQGFDGESGESTMLVAFSADESLLHLNLVVQGGLDSVNAVSLCMEHHLGVATDEMSTSESGVEEESRGEDTSTDHGNGSSDDTTEDQDEDEDNDDDEESSPYDETKDHPMFSAAPRPPFNFVPHLDETEELFSHVDEDESSDEPCLDLPLEAHILAERRTWPSVLFPVLCIASEGDIVPLVASSAYQRWAWGIDLPIVGLEISRYGSIARVHIGWVDLSSDLEHMPSVRIIRPPFDTRLSGGGLSPVAQSRQGIFNLATPQSALEFASFVLALGYQFDILRCELPSRRLRKIKWRTDNDTVPWAENIHDWCISLYKSNQSRSGARSVPDSQKDASIAKKTKTNSTSRISCSMFADIPAQNPVGGTDSEPTVTSWMLQRFAFTLARMPDWEPPIDQPPRYQDMIKSYEELSCLSWPKYWTALETLPEVDSCLTSHREKLFEGYVKRQQARTKIADLDEDLAKIMTSKLSLLLKSAAGTYTKEATPIAALEVESRHDFDALLCNFFVDNAQQVTSPNVLFERQLRLPPNTLLGGLKGDQPDECAEKLRVDIQDWVSHNYKLWNDLRSIKNPEELALKQVVSKQAFQTWSATFKIMNEFMETYPPSTAAQALRTTVEPQSTREPNRGTCDAIMVTVAPLPTESEADAAYARSVIANYKCLTGEYEKPASAKELENSMGSSIDVKSSFPSVDSEYLPSASSLKNDTTHKPGQAKEPDAFPEPTEMYDCPLGVEKSGYPSLLPARFILLPQISVEYKKPTDTERKALNQARIYCVSNAIYLGTLGIRNFPVFSLPVHGTRASLIMAWKADNDNVYLVERNVRKFDILDPIQAFHLATVILRIKAREQELIKLYNEHKGPYETKLKAGTYDIWAMPESKKTKVAPSPSAGALTSTNEVAELGQATNETL